MAEYDEPVTEVPVVEPDPGPDLDTLLEAERAKIREQELTMAKQSASYDARMKQLESMLQDRFSGKTPPPTAPMPLQVSAENFLTPEDQLAATRAIAAEAVNAGVANVDSAYRGEIMELREAQFEAKLEKLQKNDYYKYVAEDMEAAISSNPKIRYAPKALDILYANLVGNKTAEIIAAERDVGIARPVHQPLSTTRSTRPASPTAPVIDKAGVTLTAAQEASRQKFAKIGVVMSPEKWAQSLRERSGQEDIPDMEVG